MGQAEAVDLGLSAISAKESFDTLLGAAPDPSEKAGIVPKATIKTVANIRDLIFPALSVEGGHHGDHLFMVKFGFKGQLVVAHTGIGLSNFYDAVKHVLPAFSLIKRQIILFQLCRQWR